MHRPKLLAFVVAGLWLLWPLPLLHGQEKIQELAKQLALTPRQKMQLAPVLAEQAPKVKAIKNDAALSPMQKLSQLKAVRAETDPKVRAILTPGQYQKLQVIRREEAQNMMQNMRSRQRR